MIWVTLCKIHVAILFSFELLWFVEVNAVECGFHGHIGRAAHPLETLPAKMAAKSVRAMFG